LFFYLVSIKKTQSLASYHYRIDELDLYCMSEFLLFKVFINWVLFLFWAYLSYLSISWFLYLHNFYHYLIILDSLIMYHISHFIYSLNHWTSFQIHHIWELNLYCYFHFMSGSIEFAFHLCQPPLYDVKNFYLRDNLSIY